MIDTQSILKSVDLFALIEADSPGKPVKDRIFCPACQVHHTGGPALQVNRTSGFFYCHGCGWGGDAIDYIRWRDQVDFVEACTRLGWSGTQVDRETVRRRQEELREMQRIRDEQREKTVQEILSRYTPEDIWEANARNMQESHVEWWKSQGIPKGWLEYLRIGYTPDKAYYDRDGILRHSAAYVIPYFHENWAYKNTQYRLQDPLNPKDRYRFTPDLPTTYYQVMPDQPMQDRVIICEGAKKAMVCEIRGENDGKMSTFATPSKIDFGKIDEKVKGCDRVYLIPDPDAWKKPLRASDDWIPSPLKLAKLIGKAARIVRVPVKIDDGIMKHGIRLQDYLAMAVRP